MSLVKVSVPQQDSNLSELRNFHVMSIRSNNLVLYKEWFHGKQGRVVHENSLSNLELKGKTSAIKDSSKKRIERMLVGWMKAIMYENDKRASIQLRPERTPVFVTLTLPAQQIHPDQAIKRQVLMPFIQEMKRQHGLEHYFWRAELQKNYNIHFHLVADIFMDRVLLQQIWNKHLETLGYISRFEAKHGHRVPPSTHVEGITNVGKMVSYVVKYVCKESDELPVDGRKWDASQKLKDYKSVAYPVDSSIWEWIDEKCAETKISGWENEHCIIFSFTELFDYRKDYDFLKCLEYKDLTDFYKHLYEDGDQPVRSKKTPVPPPAVKPKQLELFPRGYDFTDH